MIAKINALPDKTKSVPTHTPHNDAFNSVNASTRNNRNINALLGLSIAGFAVLMVMTFVDPQIPLIIGTVCCFILIVSLTFLFTAV